MKERQSSQVMQATIRTSNNQHIERRQQGRTQHQYESAQGDRAREGDNLRDDRANRRRTLASRGRSDSCFGDQQAEGLQLSEGGDEQRQ